MEFTLREAMTFGQGTHQVQGNLYRREQGEYVHLTSFLPCNLLPSAMKSPWGGINSVILLPETKNICHP